MRNALYKLNDIGYQKLLSTVPKEVDQNKDEITIITNLPDRYLQKFTPEGTEGICSRPAF